MSRTGLEDAYIMRGSKKLRMGYTTGSCAAAAARGAAFMLLSGKEIQEVKIHTPKGIVLNLELLDIQRSAEKVSCAVRKDGGDDPDVTDKALIYAEVTFGTEEGIVIDGGFGVGRVTKPGLDQPVGNAAINHVPRQMIRENVEEIQKKLDDFRALQVVISVPEGEELAKHTFNPRLGITGGISILGTSGIVVPMSEEALISTIRVEMEMRKAQGDRVLLVTPGNYGQDFLKTYPWVRADHSVKCSNYVGKTLEFAAELGFDAILFVAHLGKFVKVSGGIMNTHSHEADCRAELLTAQAVRAGADLALAKKLLETGTTEEAVQILKEAGCLKETMEKVTEKIAFYMNYHIEGRVQTEAIVFSSNEGLLGETPGAGELLERLREQEEKEAQYIATALEIYVTGSLNVFNHQSNVDIDNRIVCYDIKELGKQLKKIGMLVVQDQVWNRVTINRAAHKSTRYYIDEMHLLLKEEQTAAYTVEIWKRFRKWGGIPTGITQNVKDLLSSREVENIFENSDFVYMLNQAGGDRQILAKQLGISTHQLSYVTHSGEGEGLLFYGSTILPFVDHFPKNTELYRIMTTKPQELKKKEDE